MSIVSNSMGTIQGRRLVSNKVRKIILDDNPTGLEIYANDGTTLLFSIDSSGNVGIKGDVGKI